MAEGIRSTIGRVVLEVGRGDTPRVSYGLAGFIRLASTELFITPKVFGDVTPDSLWGHAAPEFLHVCRNLRPGAIFVSGTGGFAANRRLLRWWSDHYANVLSRALHVSPYLRYEPISERLPYLRGRIDWPRQTREWSQGGYELWCRYRRYQVDNPLNRLLIWAAMRFIAVSGSTATRTRLGKCLEMLAGVPPLAPTRTKVDRLRLPLSMEAYREPLTIARALYDSIYPSLNPGRLPATGFLIDMPAAFEAFVDGLIARVVDRARLHGLGWRFASQRQKQLAVPLAGERSFYTRPDNLVWGATQGIVVDAKYKGVAADPERYARPVSSDLYQIVSSCLARGWHEALILAPLTSASSEAALPGWTVPILYSDDRINVHLKKIDLGQLRAADGVSRLVDELFFVIRDRIEGAPTQVA